jgi:hypothetical protein
MAITGSYFNQNKTYNAEDLRQVATAAYPYAGVLGPNDLKVISCSVASGIKVTGGRAVTINTGVLGTTSGISYIGAVSTSINASSSTNGTSWPAPTYWRADTVWGYNTDSLFSANGDSFNVVWVKGTDTNSGSGAAISSSGANPDATNSTTVPLARILTSGGAAPVITDLRRRVGARGGVHVSPLETRPAVGNVGDQWYTTDDNQMWVSDGATWKTHPKSGINTYTPTLLFAGTPWVTIGNGSLIAEYQYDGSYVDVFLNVKVGLTSNGGGGTGAFQFTLPPGFLPYRTSNTPPTLGTCTFLKSLIGRGAFIANFPLTNVVEAFATGFGGAGLRHDTGGGSGWTPDDEVIFQLRYRYA